MAADSKIFHSLPVWIKNHMWMLLFRGKALILQQNSSCVMSLNNAEKKNCGNGLKNLSGGTDEPSTLSGSISWEHLVPLLLISGGTAVKWSNASCGQQGRLAWWHHQYHHHISQRMAKRPGMLLCPILLRTSSQTIHFHFPKTLKSAFWSSFSATIPRCSPHWSCYQIIFFTSVVWWCSKWWVRGWRGQWGLKRDHGGPRWGWLLCCPENRPWFPGTMQLMRNSPRKICVWHHGFLKLAAEPTLSCHNQLPVNFHCWRRERSRGRGWKGACRGVDVHLAYACGVVCWLYDDFIIWHYSS